MRPDLEPIARVASAPVGLRSKELSAKNGASKRGGRGRGRGRWGW